MFKGSIVALVTPFKDGEFDEASYKALIDWHITSGTHAIVPCGTTGESATLTVAEHEHVVKTCIETVKGRVPVIAGAGSNSTAESVNLAQHAQKYGADAILAVSPYYNKPSQEGIYRHYKAVHDASDIPIILYNVPGRTASNIEVETVKRLAELPRIAGIKDASPDLARPLQMRTQIGSGFCLLSGEDATVAAYLAQGGDGCISVTANAAPALCAQLHEAWQAKDFDTFEAIRDRLMPLHDAMFCEPNPVPAKFAVSKLGHANDDVRLPLVQLTDAGRAQVEAAMRHAGVLN